ncbi:MULTISPECIES: recombination-associated protein RdgC [Glaesserella]|uniref:Recombination-associated protein RdgC n=1 Tax=Glaesserella australis TaxID=2094024 RepID=A0A328C5J5_9PAST|nr:MULTISPECIES: recombination-associated protein RdgC [Glaesserella]AUI65587.1 recombination-associated protein RdgC [Glaesserella sp. 15-184]RAL19784.1 recombination-associated protein RdgC [Glaesserella australis]
MHWFKNTLIYRLTSAVDFSNIEEALQQNKYTECQPLDYRQFGWDKPLVTSDQLHFSVNGQILLIAHKEEKNIPAGVVKKEAESRIAELEEKEQRKLKKIEKQAIKDDVVTMLLPRAFSKHQLTAVWIDTIANLIYVDSPSASRAENALALLRKSLGSLPVIPLSFNLPPSETMTKWLSENSVPQWLTLLEEGKLRSFDTDSQVTFKHQDLESDEITQHLQAGKFVTSLALEWENHLSFTLNEDGSISKIKFADDILEKNDDIIKEDVAQRFDADFFLMTAELSGLIERLADEFGGIKQSN